MNVIKDEMFEGRMQMPHCFVSSERTDEIAKDAFNRMISFIKQEVISSSTK